MTARPRTAALGHCLPHSPPHRISGGCPLAAGPAGSCSSKGGAHFRGSLLPCEAAGLAGSCSPHPAPPRRRQGALELQAPRSGLGRLPPGERPTRGRGSGRPRRPHPPWAPGPAWGLAGAGAPHPRDQDRLRNPGPPATPGHPTSSPTPPEGEGPALSEPPRQMHRAAASPRRAGPDTTPGSERPRAARQGQHRGRNVGVRGWPGAARRPASCSAPAAQPLRRAAPRRRGVPQGPGQEGS